MLPSSGDSTGSQTESWLRLETPPASPAPMSVHPSCPVDRKRATGSFPHCHHLPIAFAEAFMNVCPDYCNTPLLFLSIPSLPFPFNVNPPAGQVPLLWKVINGSKYLQSKSKLICRPYQTFWAPTLANLCIYFNLHLPKLLIFFLSLSLLLPLHALSFPLHPVKSS